MRLRPFELGLIAFFAFLAITALFLLAVIKPPTDEGDTMVVIGTVNIWGTIPKKSVDEALSKLVQDDKKYMDVKYTYVRPEDFDARLTKATIDEVAPDLLLVSHENLVDLRRRIIPIPEESLPRRDFQNSYIDGAEIYALHDGVYALPIAIDPLAMYWNRTMLAEAGFTLPPTTWESLVSNYFPRLIELRADRSVVRSVVAMGEYGNVRNAFGIISALFIQGGSSGVKESDRGYSISLSSSFSGGNDPLRSATDFYTRFGQSNNTLYSWNRSFSDDRLRFLGNGLAFYFGYTSEGQDIEQLNPNLNFDIARIPQGEKATLQRTYGKVYGLYLLRSSKNPNGAYFARYMLSQSQYADIIANSAGMSSVFRTSVSKGSNDRYGRIAYESAPITFGWLNPNPKETAEAFNAMVDDINGNRRDLKDAVGDVETRLRNLY